VGSCPKPAYYTLLLDMALGSGENATCHFVELRALEERGVPRAGGKMEDGVSAREVGNEVLL